MVAIAMRDGPAVGLALIEAIYSRGDLKDYHLARAACADLYQRRAIPDRPALRMSARSPSPSTSPSAGLSSAGSPIGPTEPR